MTIDELDSGPGAESVRLRPPPVAARPRTAAEAPPTHPVVLPQVSTDPLDELVDRIRPGLTRAVDALQVAAALEADGCTDRIARVEYGFADVFALAAEVFRRLGPPVDPPGEVVPVARSRAAALRLVAHGPLYALPAAVFPAVLALLGRRPVVLTLTVAGALGWMAAGTVAFAAYRLAGSGRPGAAARLLLLATLLAPPAGALAGLVAGGGDPGLAALAAGQLAYQLAATVLMFYRREPVQAAVMAPAVVAGVAFLTAGPALRGVALLTAAAGVAGVFAVALGATRGRGAPGEPPARPLLRAETPALTRVTAYGLCSAALLLHAEAPYLMNRLDIAVAVAPLILAMGFVEWRAERFRAEAVRLTGHTHSPREFGVAVWRLVGRQILACLAVGAALGLALLAGLAAAGRLTGPAALMTAAHVVLGGAYYPAFVLAGFERFGRLCAFLLAATATHLVLGAALGAAPLFGQTSAPTTDTAVFLGSTVLLLSLLLSGLRPILGQVRHYR